MINTGSSPEMRAKVDEWGIGLNVEAEEPHILADAILELADDPGRCAEMGANARRVAEEKFDQEHSYQVIVDLVKSLVS
jgi:glycosyltransferase involved in cell wall biosynthesis